MNWLERLQYRLAATRGRRKCRTEGHQIRPFPLDPARGICTRFGCNDGLLVLRADEWSLS